MMASDPFSNFFEALGVGRPKLLDVVESFLDEFSNEVTEHLRFMELIVAMKPYYDDFIAAGLAPKKAFVRATLKAFPRAGRRSSPKRKHRSVKKTKASVAENTAAADVHEAHPRP